MTLACQVSDPLVVESNSREVVANLAGRIVRGWTRANERTEETLLSPTRPYGSGSNGRQPIGLNPSDRKVVRVRIPSRAPPEPAFQELRHRQRDRRSVRGRPTRNRRGTVRSKTE